MGGRSGEPDDIPVTRIEVLDFVGELFGHGPVARDAILDAARADGAREQLLQLLAGLPPTEIDSVEDLWRHLGDVPEDLSEAQS